MKIAIGYAPLNTSKGTPLLAQNRQFQWVSRPSYMYPMIPAYAATLLERQGHEILWADGIAEGKTYTEWIREIEKADVELILMETKTPVVKTHWRVIDDLKRLNPGTKIVLVGDHVSALPEESMANSKVDYILTGGDYDFLLANLVGHLEGKEKLEPGIWFRENGSIRNTGRFELNHNLDELPIIDRDLTKWWLYSKNVGNYKKIPGTYTMVGRDCWHHKCKFCSWAVIYPQFRVRNYESLLDEIEMLTKRYGIKEIMDDTGTFPIGNWLKKFCKGMIDRELNKEVVLDCNMRFGALSFEDYKLMAEAGFRFLLFGLESANQRTLNKLNKNVAAEEIINSCKKASDAGLEPHITIMFGFPWETKEEVQKTLELGKHLLKKGYAKTAQATIVMPYPGTSLFEEAKKNGQIKTFDWDRYDMGEPVMVTPMRDEEIIELVQKVYEVGFDFEFILRTLVGIRSLDDVKFIFRNVGKLLGHVKDYSRKAHRVRGG
jgi:radical SAM superfamily enzyme YgiQ (UPF0313 family)